MWRLVNLQKKKEPGYTLPMIQNLQVNISSLSIILILSYLYNYSIIVSVQTQFAFFL